MDLNHTLHELKISLLPAQATIDSYMGGKSRETYPEWIAESFTMRGQRGNGNTPKEAVEDLLTKLNIT